MSSPMAGTCFQSVLKSKNQMPMFTSYPFSPSFPASKIKKKPRWIQFLYSVALFFTCTFMCPNYFCTSSNLQKLKLLKTAGRENPDGACCLFAGSICWLSAGRRYLSAPCRFSLSCLRSSVSAKKEQALSSIPPFFFPSFL